jgi:hypothetical protein
MAQVMSSNGSGVKSISNDEVGDESSAIGYGKIIWPIRADAKSLPISFSGAGLHIPSTTYPGIPS